MIYSRSWNKTLYRRINEKCGNEKCYCQPYNSPLEIVHTFTLDQVKKLMCDPTITAYTIESVHYGQLSGGTTYLLNPNQYFLYQDDDLNTYLRLLEHVDEDCFYMTISIDYTSALSPTGNLVVLYTEPYCRVGENTMQYLLVLYDSAVDISTANFQLSDGCTFGLQPCSGFHFEYIITGPLGFLLLSVDTSYFNGATVVEAFGGDIQPTPLLITKKDVNCVPYFKIQSDFTNGVDCNGNHHFTGFEVSVSGLKALCGNPYRTIIGQVFVRPNTVGTKMAGDSQIIVGQSSTKNLQITSTNNHNIASWALNEIGAMLTSKGVKIVYSGNPETNSSHWFIVRDSGVEIYIQPNSEIEDKFLSVGLKSKDCMNYFTC